MLSWPCVVAVEQEGMLLLYCWDSSNNMKDLSSILRWPKRFGYWVSSICNSSFACFSILYDDHSLSTSLFNFYCPFHSLSLSLGFFLTDPFLSLLISNWSDRKARDIWKVFGFGNKKGGGKLCIFFKAKIWKVQAGRKGVIGMCLMC